MSEHFIVEYLDSGDLALREAHRAEHIAFRVALGDDLLLAGPLLGADSKAIGSLILIRADGLAAAEAIATADPLVKAGVLSMVSARPFRIAKISALPVKPS